MIFSKLRKAKFRSLFFSHKAGLRLLMKHRKSFGVVVLVAGVAVLGEGQGLHALEKASEIGSSVGMLLFAMGGTWA